MLFWYPWLWWYYFPLCLFVQVEYKKPKKAVLPYGWKVIIGGRK